MLGTEIACLLQGEEALLEVLPLACSPYCPQVKTLRAHFCSCAHARHAYVHTESVHFIAAIALMESVSCKSLANDDDGAQTGREEQFQGPM